MAIIIDAVFTEIPESGTSLAIEKVLDASVRIIGEGERLAMQEMDYIHRCVIQMQKT